MDETRKKAALLQNRTDRSIGVMRKMLPKRVRHWSPRYIKNRVARFLYEKRHGDEPWLTKQAVEFLGCWLTASDTGFEWGSGRSTVWFALRTAGLVSVEHNPLWAARVMQRIGEESLETKVEYHQISEDEIGGAEASRYEEVVNGFPADRFDYCLVDGVRRDHCALACLDKVKTGGILIVDNVNWYVPRERPSSAPNSRGLKDGFASESWQTFGAAVRKWRCYWTTDGITDTAIWFKP